EDSIPYSLILALIANDDVAVRQAAIDCVAACHASGLPTLKAVVRRVDDGVSVIRERAFSLLVRMRTTEEAVLDRLMLGLSVDPEGVFVCLKAWDGLAWARAWARAAMADATPAAAGDALTFVLRDGCDDVKAVSLLRTFDAAGRPRRLARVLGRALGKKAAHEEEVRITVLGQIAKSREDAYHEVLLEALEQIEKQYREVCPPFLPSSAFGDSEPTSVETSGRSRRIRLTATNA
ncbi:MAG TPA: hypothetical protein VNG33_17490, partial [Polyangiaceae bacterium]|nr:hypothetical protein [Polyangiaceae bacterium]